MMSRLSRRNALQHASPFLKGEIVSYRDCGYGMTVLLLASVEIPCLSVEYGIHGFGNVIQNDLLDFSGLLSLTFKKRDIVHVFSYFHAASRIREFTMVCSTTNLDSGTASHLIV